MAKKLVPFLVLCLSLVGSAFSSSGGADSAAPGFTKTEGTPLLVVVILVVAFLVVAGIVADKAGYE